MPTIELPEDLLYRAKDAVELAQHRMYFHAEGYPSMAVSEADRQYLIRNVETLLQLYEVLYEATHANN
jgi:hypothetical protein